MTSSGLHCEVCVVHFKWIQGESGWIMCKVCEWFDGCDRL